MKTVSKVFKMGFSFTSHPLLVSCQPKPSLCHLRRSQRVPLGTKPRKALYVSTAIAPSGAEEKSVPGTTKFSWTERWFPVIFERDFDSTRPYPFTIWETNLVMFLDNSGKYVVLDDVCPHRAASLSEGRITTSTTGETALECPYHGWSFNCTGNCVQLPQLPDNQRIPTAANMKKVYETAVRDGIVFVWFGKEGDANAADIPRLNVTMSKDKCIRKVVYHQMARLLPYDVITLVENVIDPEHANWSHHGTEKRWNRSRSSNKVHFKVRLLDHESGTIVNDYHHPGDDPGQSSELAIRGVFDVTYKTIIDGIGEAHFRILSVPRDRQQCQVFFSDTMYLEKDLWSVRLFAARPVWMQHWHLNNILDGDSSVLRAQERTLQRSSENGEPTWRRNFVLAMGPLDSCVLAFRKWLDNYADSIPWRSDFVRPGAIDHMSRKELLDRLDSHTRNCKACTAAMKSMQRLRLFALASSALSTAFVLDHFVVLGSGNLVTSTGNLPLEMSIGSVHNFSANGANSTVALAAGIGVFGIVVAAGLTKCLERFVYTDRAYQLSHSD